MHMADALLSPVVGAAMWGASAMTGAYCARRLDADPDERRVPLMGVLGAFLFAAQMINFSIPGTGSSGHLGGGLLLAILLGPHAAFLVMASVLVVQALFFADGGLLALGANVFNLGFFPAFVGYPLYRLLCGTSPSPVRAASAAVVAAVVSLQLGAFAVVLQTVASGVSALPLPTFLLFMLPIHLAIGVVEGLVTASLVGYVRRTRPDVLPDGGGKSVRGAAVAFLVAALALGAVGAWYASKDPDGLEWSIARVAGQAEVPGVVTQAHAALADVQQRVALLPDYDLPRREGAQAAGEGDAHSRLGTSLSGIVGGVLTLLVAVCAGSLAARRARRADARLR